MCRLAHHSTLVAWQAAAANVLAAAMMAVLPGIDANDEPKTLAAFRFFCIVLSSVGELSVRLPRPRSPHVLAALREWNQVSLVLTPRVAGVCVFVLQTVLARSIRKILLLLWGDVNKMNE